ncbi:MAG: heparinase II/III family protein [Butyrivibrio sp.]|nr:heparinase II/III family protein [Butyrivibrio sp.]
MPRTVVKDFLKHTKGCGIFDLYPNISDRDRWNALSDELKNDLISAGEKALNEPWTMLLISDFREFLKTGDRLGFEDKFFPRRRKLNKLVMAECVENKGRFVDDILDGLYLILEETTWCLPAHNTYIRDAKQESMPDVTRPVIDLFCAETGAEIAVCEYLLRPVFVRVSPYISGYVNERLKERIFEPYMNMHFWWMGNGKEPMCNWTSWCTQNVLASVLTRDESFFTEDERRRFLEKAAASCDYFLDEYGDDGGCDEGAQYYSHAALTLFGCLELMRNALEQKGEREFSKVYDEELIRNVANYIVKMHAGDGYYVNFADCSALPGRRTAREYLFGKAVKDESLVGFAACDFKSESTDERLISDEINLFYHVMQAFAYDEMLALPESSVRPEDSWFESMRLMVASDDTYTLSAKAGDNGDSHNHNDVGSFTVYKNGKPFVIDLGVGTYTQKTFSDRRYEIWTMQSQFHNLPTFLDTEKDPKIVSKFGEDPEGDVYNPDIVMQKPGEAHGASDVDCILGSCEETASLTMNIAGAYADPRIRSYVRNVVFKKGGDITICDKYDGELTAVIGIMTYDEPRIISQSDNETVIEVADIGKISIEGVTETNIREFPITDDRLKIAWKHSVYRITATVADEGTCRIVCT